MTTSVNGNAKGRLQPVSRVQEGSGVRQETPDAHVIARDLAQHRKNKTAPTEFDLAKSITNIQINRSIKQVENLVISVEDPVWRFFDVGFLDLDQDSMIDPTDVNYPD